MPPFRGEVWLLDLGSIHEIQVPVSFSEPGAFLVQSVAIYPVARVVRKLGALKTAHFDMVSSGLLSWLGYATSL